jgi:hypothetical protein
MLNPRLSFAAFAALFCLATAGLADTVTLKSGEKLEGRILSDTDAEVTIEVSVSASIKDQRVVKKTDVQSIDKVQPDAEAWAGLKNIALGEESLESVEYQRYIAALNAFVTQYPQSAHAAEAKQKIAAFQEEAKRVEAGEMKLGGKWLTADEVKEERVQIEGKILFGRMKRLAAQGQLIEAMNVFEAIDKSANRSASFPDAIVLARQILPTIKTTADQARVQLKARTDEAKRRLQNVTGADRAQLEAMQRQQTAQTEAAVTSFERSGLKWIPLAPATDRSLATTSTKAAGALTTLNRHNVDRMKESVAATDRLREALEKEEIDVAEKALAEATSAWSQNEYISRLQPKFTAAKTKAVQAAAAAGKPVVATAGPAKKTQAKPTPNPMPAAVVDEPKANDGSVLTKPAFWIILVVILGLATLGMKAFAKFRDRSKNLLDQ